MTNSLMDPPVVSPADDPAENQTPDETAESSETVIPDEVQIPLPFSTTQNGFPIDLMIVGGLLAVITALGVYVFMRQNSQEAAEPSDPQAATTAEPREAEQSEPAATPVKPVVAEPVKKQARPSKRLSASEAALAKELSTLDQSRIGGQIDLKDPVANLERTLEYWDQLRDLISAEEEIRTEKEEVVTASVVEQYFARRVEAGYFTAGEVKQLDQTDVHNSVLKLSLRIQKWHESNAALARDGQRLLKLRRLQDPSSSDGQRWDREENELQRELNTLKQDAKLLRRSLTNYYRTPFPALFVSDQQVP